MTNPDNIVRVRARNGGRASVYEANGWAQAYTTGLVEGNGVVQNTSADMNVLVGGSASKPDVILAENPAGYKIALDLVGQQAVAVTAPATNSRISAIVAYTDDLSLQSTQDTITGSPASCGLIVVNGTASSSPSAPSDTQIRNAITADGATGSQAAYCVIATVLVANDTTTITDSLITMNVAGIGSKNIDFATFANYMNIMPSVSKNFAMPYSAAIILKRIGDLVFASGSFTSSSMVARDAADVSETIGSGYRPSSQIWVPWIRCQGGGTQMGAWTINPDGSIKYSLNIDVTSAARFSYSSVWVTNDPWPSS